jgi:hypothetical protein
MHTGYDDPIDATPTLRDPDGSWDEDEVLDQALRLVADHHRELGQSIGRRVFSPSIAELRQSPLGRDLRLLVAAAYGDAMPEAAKAAAERVRETLLRPLAADTYAVPAWFWGSELGRIVARAERKVAGEAAFVSLLQAEAWLGVPAADLSAWMEDGRSALGAGRRRPPAAAAERGRAAADRRPGDGPFGPRGRRGRGDPARAPLGLKHGFRAISAAPPIA